ncbi:endonuclease domain-containing protein [Xanthomonas translucens]|nr:DUF559 domain-containing protein [Xanthomonas translucens]UPU47783.1 endonuclease domain-containing protein [Xanthomonas translucens pv. undulosa]
MAALSQAYNGKLTQSPIEDMMLGALLWLNMDYSGFPLFDLIGGPEDELHRERRRSFDPVTERLSLECLLSAQPQIAGYAVDFLLWFTAGRKHGGIVIECDGHAFHEKTKEQAARDKRRDREILGAGYPVIRFSGSEVFRDVAGCTEQIHSLAFPIMERVAREAGLIS